MSRLAQHGHETTGDRGFRPRYGRAGRLAGGLALALPLALVQVPAAQAQTSGIYINNDVLNSLGPGPDAAAPAPLAPDAPPTPLSPRNSMTYQPPALALPPAGQPNNGLSFQTYGSGNYVVTRPGTLLFPPLEAPTSTLAPGFEDNHAARTEAMNNAFAGGPEPSSQLLIPLHDAAPANDNSVVVFMENLPSADSDAGAADAPRVTLRNPAAAPGPAPRKPEVSPEMLAETGATTIDDAGLAPEFQAGAAEAPVPQEPVTAKAPMTESAPVAEPAATPAAAATTQASESTATASAAAEQTAAPESSASVAAPLANPSPAAASAPVSLLPDSAATPVETTELAGPPAAQPAASQPVAAPTPATVQTASLNVGPVGDMSVLFDGDSAELSENVQADLRALANSMQASEDRRIQVLGFASSEGGSEDLARKLALSRALKVRTFLIDAGVASTRIQVRSLGDKSEGGPANRVDIRPIDS
jgi:outer membrane protein OmpA-like peptidoglycan-associated protein